MKQYNEEDTKIVIWSMENTKLLLDVYKSHKGDVGTMKVKNFKKMWEIIAEELKSSYGLNVSPGNCENRWRVLERNFKKYVDNNKSTGRRRKDFEYAEEMFNILGKKRNIYPELLLTTKLKSNESNQKSVEVIEDNFQTNDAPSTSKVTLVTSKSIIGKKKFKSNMLEKIRKERKEYFEKRLQIEKEKLQVEKQKLQQWKIRNKLISERNKIMLRKFENE